MSCALAMCTGEAPARQCLVTRGLLPLLAEGSARATDSDTTDEILHAAIEYSKVGAGGNLCCHQVTSGGPCHGSISSQK